MAEYDSADPVQVAKAEKAEADKLRDLDYILKEVRGRRWVYGLIHDVCHTNQISHVPTDSDTTAFNEGGRAVGLRILEEVKSQAPAKFMLMLEENAFNE